MILRKKTQPKQMLYVEDDPDDREVLYDAFRKANTDIEVAFAENGQVALDYLKKLTNDKKQLPCLIVLDLNMPKVDGKETLKKIKSEAHLENIPTIIFTSSVNPKDKLYFNDQSIELIVKPTNVDKYKDIVTHFIEVCTSK